MKNYEEIANAIKTLNQDCEWWHEKKGLKGAVWLKDRRDFCEIPGEAQAYVLQDFALVTLTKIYNGIEFNIGAEVI